MTMMTKLLQHFIDEWARSSSCFSRRLNGNKLNHLVDGTFGSLKQLQRLYEINACFIINSER